MFPFVDLHYGENHDIVVRYRKPRILKLVGEVASIVTGGIEIAKDADIRNWGHQPHFRSGNYPTAMIQGVLGPRFISNSSQKTHRANGIDCVNMGPLFNVGPLITSIEDMQKELDRLFIESGGKKITLDCHSLGGIYGIYLAEKNPDKVEKLILRGVPAEASAQELRHITHLAVLHDLMKIVHWKFHADFIDNWQPMSKRTPLKVPVFVMIARNDGIIDPHSCVMPKSDLTRQAVFDCTHFDLIAKDPIDQYASNIVKEGLDAHIPQCVESLIVPLDHHLNTFTFALAH